MVTREQLEAIADDVETIATVVDILEALDRLDLEV